MEITSLLGRVPASIHRQRGVPRLFTRPPPFSSTFSLFLAETGSRFHEILPVMSVASITRHYPSISRFSTVDVSKKETFRRSDTRIGPSLLSFHPVFIFVGYITYLLPHLQLLYLILLFFILLNYDYNNNNNNCSEG